MNQMNLDNCLSLQVHSLARSGVLKGGYASIWSWWCNDRKTASIGIEAAFDSIRLSYKADGQPMSYSIQLEHTACHFGGTRPWFCCPACGRRVAVLYSRGTFVCRQCAGLNYASQNEAARWRANSAAWKIRFALGLKAGDIRPAYTIPKAKGRHWKTHWRMIARLERLEGASISCTAAWLKKQRELG